jgi:hypothetical protein
MKSGLKNDQNRPRKDPRYRPAISRLVKANIRDLLRHGLLTISTGEMENSCIKYIPPGWERYQSSAPAFSSLKTKDKSRLPQRL